MKTQQNIIIKILSVVVLLAVLFPSAVKFAHVLEQHEHEVCIDNSTTHMHEVDFDCEFYKFKLTTQYYSLLESDDLILEDNYSKICNTSYNFRYNHQQLSYSLRGPPQLV
ncbi:hypothetical protein [Olleya sp. YS]|uniref:hypothetical protein n=1 Tax=Olleya sp. YS TaxID=3028318 RepID=UPI0024340F0C|nr:hypothetical protein [Olleya sp. YS]WGD34615.1 hypothetical protein Ollyesu_12595 [Olleya sp. YS]